MYEDPGHERAEQLPSDFGLTGDLSGIQESLPLDGLTEELDHPRFPEYPGWLRLPPGCRRGAHYVVGRHPARQGAEIAVYERPLGPEGDLDYLFAVGGHRGVRVANLGEVEDSEPHLGVHLAVSRAGHLGSQMLQFANR